MAMGDEQEEMPGGGMGEGQGYALSGKIMLSAIVILFFVVILMVTLHLYARWYLTRARRRHVVRRNGRNRRTHLVFYVDPTNQNPAAVTVTRGLDSSVLRSLPVFTYSSKTHPDSSLECAVCLSEFEENESGRVLPKCNHSFHLQCIDMWFHSHSTCPLCRSPVEPGPTRPENPDEVVLDIAEPGSSEPASSSGLCVTCRDEGTSSLGGRRKPTEIDVPRRNIEDFVDESTRCDSPASQSFKSPMSRMLSFTRILSRDRRAASSLSSPSSANLASCGSVTELDIERGRDETQLTQG